MLCETQVCGEILRHMGHRKIIHLYWVRKHAQISLQTHGIGNWLGLVQVLFITIFPVLALFWSSPVLLSENIIFWPLLLSAAENIIFSSCLCTTDMFDPVCQYRHVWSSLVWSGLVWSVLSYCLKISYFGLCCCLVLKISYFHHPYSAAAAAPAWIWLFKPTANLWFWPWEK